MDQAASPSGFFLRLPRLQRGGALLLSMVLLGAFVVMFIAAATLINRQFHQITQQEQEEQAFQVAEAGVFYALWFIDQDLLDLSNPGNVTDYEVTDPTTDPAEVIGNFDLTFTVRNNEVGGPVTVDIVSVGEDAVLSELKQTIRATIHSRDGDDFRIVEWRHDV